MKDPLDDPAAHAVQRTFTPTGREDCWSEGATAALVDAWGERHLQLSRGNLRQSDWRDVADSVNSRQLAAGKARKSDIQCKNRIDTLKKKYKLEKSKPGPSRWIFFDRLDYLIGPTPTRQTQINPPHLAKPLKIKSPIQDNHSNNHSSSFHPNYHPNHHHSNNNQIIPYAPSSSSGNSSESLQGCGSGSPPRTNGVTDRKHKREEDYGFSELARAVLKFGEIYERIETAKQQQMIELERQRMEFTKDLEFQRMQMFMEGQLELEKVKRPKHNSCSGKKL